MTTKPKTRRAPAAKAATPKPSLEADAAEPTQPVRTIERLVAKWRWLEADATYKSTRARTDKEDDAALCIHDQERREIEGMLSTLVPRTFLETCNLLGFASQLIAEGGRHDRIEIAMLSHIKEALPKVWCNEVEAERVRAREEATVEARHSVELAFKVNDIIAKRKEREAA
ncbi:MAG: hypothetical protein ACLQFI_14210 [Methylocella sp.]